ADHQYLHSFPTRRSSDLDRHVEEVSQIAHDIGSASTQQSAPLHRQCWCHVRSRPSRSAIKRVGDIKMPDAGEAALIGIAGRTSVRRSRSIESHGCSAVAPANRRRKGDVLHTVRSTYVIHVRPGLALVTRNRDTGAGPKI